MKEKFNAFLEQGDTSGGYSSPKMKYIIVPAGSFCNKTSKTEGPEGDTEYYDEEDAC